MEVWVPRHRLFPPLLLVSCRAVLRSPGGQSKPQTLRWGSRPPARLWKGAGGGGVQSAQSSVGSGTEGRPDGSTWKWTPSRGYWDQICEAACAGEGM